MHEASKKSFFIIVKGTDLKTQYRICAFFVDVLLFDAVRNIADTVTLV